jgi:hypothetical protein
MKHLLRNHENFHVAMQLKFPITNLAAGECWEVPQALAAVEVAAESDENLEQQPLAIHRFAVLLHRTRYLNRPS